MHCPRCNALNPDDAKFCSLCLHKLGSEKQPEEPSLPFVRLPDEDPTTQQAWEAAATTAAGGSEVVSGPLKKTEKGVTWFCPSCDNENAFESNRCRVCGSTIFDAFREPENIPLFVGKSATVAGLISAVPGVGHLYLGNLSEGITRLLLGIWWFGTALFLPAVTPVLLVAKVIFILASIGLAGVCVFDAYRLADDASSPPLLDRRVIFFGSLGLFILTVVAVVSTGVALRD